MSALLVSFPTVSLLYPTFSRFHRARDDIFCRILARTGGAATGQLRCSISVIARFSAIGEDNGSGPKRSIQENA
jgi:hypothetical protein